MKIKHLFVGFLTYFILSSNLLVAFAATGDFTDVSPSYPNYTAIMYLKNSAVIQGYPDGTFKPDQPINRVEALKIILLGSKITVTDSTGTAGFKDINPSAWYAKYIINGVQLGIIQGYPDGTFKSAQTVNLVENLKMLFKAENIDLSKTAVTQNPYADAFTDQWYAKYVQYAKDKNLINADNQNRIYPAQGMSRAKLAEILYRLTYIQQHQLSSYPNPAPSPDSVSTLNPPAPAPTPSPSPAPTPAPSPTPPAIPSSGLSLKVVGNHLIDANSKTVRLLGVNRSGQEFECIQAGTPGSLGWGLFDGPTDLVSAQAIASWHANTVRLPLNEDCWLGINGVNPQWSGPAYQDAIKTYIATLHQAGLYVILDLHWNSPGTIPAAAQQPMPDADHAVDFWKSVATAFASDQGVVFDLYNEPFLYGSYTQDPNQDLWDCWLNGCTLNQYLTGGDPYTKPYVWNAVGMQKLVDTVRTTGATNVIMVGGLEWANDLTGWATHKPTDPQNAIVASWHSYPGQTCSTETCWNSVIAPLAVEVPIVTGEVGDSVCNAPTYIPTFLPWANIHGLSYLGWTWNTWGDCDHILIKDYSGTPTANYGQTFHDLLFSATNTII